MKIPGLIYLFLAFLLFSSCSTEGDGCDKLVPIANLEDLYGCENTAYQMEIDLTEDHTIIRSQAEFEELVSGSCLPEIDFTEHNLVIGKKSLSNGLVSIDFKLINECDKDKFILYVTFTTGTFMNAPNVTYHALIPRLAENETLEVQIINKTRI